MLPSGNDAAALLAFYYGYWLDKDCTFPNLIFTKARKVDLKDKIKYNNLMTKKFMQYLNDKIIKTELNHQNTHLENPHGLSNKFQVFLALFKVSTAWEVAEAAIHFMKTSKVFILYDFRIFEILQKPKTIQVFTSMANSKQLSPLNGRTQMYSLVKRVFRVFLI